MSDLRSGLGGHLPRNGPLPKLGLTLHELGELIRRAGRTAGFVVESEYQIRPADDGNSIGAAGPSVFDPIVAIEIEGHGVQRLKKSLPPEATPAHAASASYILLCPNLRDLRNLRLYKCPEKAKLATAA